MQSLTFFGSVEREAFKVRRVLAARRRRRRARILARERRINHRRRRAVLHRRHVRRLHFAIKHVVPVDRLRARAVTTRSATQPRRRTAKNSCFLITSPSHNRFFGSRSSHDRNSDLAACVLAWNRDESTSAHSTRSHTSPAAGGNTDNGSLRMRRYIFCTS
jgi:hypothetical protein